MLQNAFLMEAPITALCGSQTLDISMRDIQISSKEWKLLRVLQRFSSVHQKGYKQVDNLRFTTVFHIIYA